MKFEKALQRAKSYALSHVYRNNGPSITVYENGNVKIEEPVFRAITVDDLMAHDWRLSPRKERAA